MPIIVVTSRDNIQAHVLEEGKPLFLGRSTECDIVLPATAVSRRHAVILYKDGVCGIKDLGSFNGTELNGERIQEPQQFLENDVLRISSYIIRLYTKDPEQSVQEETESPQKESASTSKSGRLRSDSRRFENSSLPLPRAMQLEQEHLQRMSSIQEDPPLTRDTSRFHPGRDTARFIRSVVEENGSPKDASGKKGMPGDSSSSSRQTHSPAQEQSSETSPPSTKKQTSARGAFSAKRSGGKAPSSYFTPFPLPESLKNGGEAATPSSSSSTRDLTEFEESPLSSLDEIGQFDDAPPTPFLAASEQFDAMTEVSSSLSSNAEYVIPLESEVPGGMNEYSSAAEAVIPLMDDTPLVSTLDDNDDDSPASASGPLRKESPPLASDTAIYTLSPGFDDMGDDSADDDYEVAGVTELTDDILSEGGIPDVSFSSEDGEGVLHEIGADGGDDDSDDDEGDDEDGDDGLFSDDGGDEQAERELLEDIFGGSAGSLFDGDLGEVPIGRTDTGRIGIKGKSPLFGIAGVTISSKFMAAINARLLLYSQLNELSEKRRRYRLKYPSLSEDVDEELSRQDNEMECLPTTEEAERQLLFLRDRKAQLIQAIRQAKEAGVQEPPKPTAAMTFAEDLAVTQWRMIIESHRQALPAVYREAYSLAAKEPLVKELNYAGIRHGRLMGGAIYLLALESLETMATQKRFRIANSLAGSPESEEEGDGFLGKLGDIGKKAGNIAKWKRGRKQTERLREEDRVNFIRGELARRESAFIEKVMAREFIQMYTKVALHYIPSFATMPVPIRAFLRHGVLGFSPWWMSKEVRDYIVRDCVNNVISEQSPRINVTNILYADEYLYAVSQMECSPSFDESLSDALPGSVEWRTDRAFRRIVNARTYNVLMSQMLTLQRVTGEYFKKEEIELEDMIDSMRRQSFSRGRSTFDLSARLQQVYGWHKNISKNVERIKDEVIPTILDAIEDAERLFRTGDLRIPDQETLLRREVEALFRLCRYFGSGRERFVPMAVREHYRYDKERRNDRNRVRETLAKMEALDPGIFVRTVIPSKHKRCRVNLRMSPVVLIFPSAGESGVCSMGREGMECGHLVVPSCLARDGLRTTAFTNMLADFRWETSLGLTGRDVYSSDTLVGAFSRVCRDVRSEPVDVREKRLIFTNLSGLENWRKIYSAYLPDAMTGGQTLFQCNPALYSAILGVHIEVMDGVKILRTTTFSQNDLEQERVRKFGR